MGLWTGSCQAPLGDFSHPPLYCHSLAAILQSQKEENSQINTQDAFSSERLMDSRMSSKVTHFEPWQGSAKTQGREINVLIEERMITGWWAGCAIGTSTAFYETLTFASIA